MTLFLIVVLFYRIKWGRIVRETSADAAQNGNAGVGGGVVRYFSIFYFFFLFLFFFFFFPPPLFAASTLRIMFPPPGETSAGGHECGKRRSPFGGIVLHFRYYPTGAIGLQ